MITSKKNIELKNGFFWIAFPNKNICSIISVHIEQSQVYFLGESKPVQISDLIKMEEQGEIEIISYQAIPTILLNKHYQN